MLSNKPWKPTLQRPSLDQFDQPFLLGLGQPRLAPCRPAVDQTVHTVQHESPQPVVHDLPGYRKRLSNLSHRFARSQTKQCRDPSYQSQIACGLRLLQLLDPRFGSLSSRAYNEVLGGYYYRAFCLLADCSVTRTG